MPASSVRALVQATSDRRQGIDDPEREERAHEAAKRARRSSCSRSCSTARTSARSRTLSTTATRSSSPRPDDQAVQISPGDRHGRHRTDVRGGAQATASTTTRPRSSTPTGRISASTARPTSRTSRGSGRSSTSTGEPRLPGLRDGDRQGRRVHLLRPALPGGRACSWARRRRDGVHPVGDVTRPLGVPVADRTTEPCRGQRLLRRDDQPGRHRGRVR